MFCSANFPFLFGHCALHSLSVAVLHYPSGNCALYFLTVLLIALCSVHCPSGAFLLCTTLWCHVLYTGSDSGLPFWSSVLCPTHNVHYASVQPFLGHCVLQCPFSALCSAQPFLGFALYLPLWGTLLCTALLGRCVFTLSFLGTVPTTDFWGVVLFTAPLRYCIIYYSYGAVFCTAPLEALYSVLPLLCTTYCSVLPL